MPGTWKPPSDWISITTIDAHTAGEPLRVITGGLPEIPGNDIMSRRRYLKENLDHLRTALMWEPRGHADMYGCILTEPVTEDGTLGVLFLHNEGYSSMCGHGIIGLTKVVLDTGMMDIEEERPELRIDTPAGRVTATAHRDGDRVGEVSFLNVPSFVLALDEQVEVPGIGLVKYDVAFGGAFYAFCRAEDLGFRLEVDEYSALIDTGMRIKRAVMDALPIVHPLEEDLGFLYGTIFVGSPHDAANHSRNVCIFAEGQLDRSPTGTGVSARAALHHARGELVIDEPFVVESILGTCFTGRIHEAVPFGSYEAVIPEVRGQAHICGRNEWLIDPDDPLGRGFLLR
jgi:trans-L-3-hydroxyproline dehydratase